MTVLLPDFTAVSIETSETKLFCLQILQPTPSKYVSRDNWMEIHNNKAEGRYYLWTSQLWQEKTANSTWPITVWMKNWHPELAVKRSSGCVT
jgi:hypothetical protein